MHENKLVCTLSPLQLEITIPVGKEDVCIHTDQLGYGVLSVSTSKQIICTTLIRLLVNMFNTLRHCLTHK